MSRLPAPALVVAVALLSACAGPERPAPPQHEAAVGQVMPRSLIRVPFGRPLRPALDIPPRCPPFFVVLYCRIAARSGGHGAGTPEVTILKTRELRFVAVGPTTASAMGSALGPGDRVRLRGRERGGVAFVAARSGYVTLVAAFRDLGLEGGGTAEITLRCIERLPVPVLIRPRGPAVGPDLEALTRSPRVGEAHGSGFVPGVCRERT